MFRSAAIASSSAVKRAVSAATRPSPIVSRSIATAPTVPRLLANLRHQNPTILFAPPSSSSSFVGGSFRGFASRGDTTSDDSDWEQMDDEEELEDISDSEPSDYSEESDLLNMDKSDDD